MSGAVNTAPEGSVVSHTLLYNNVPVCMYMPGADSRGSRGSNDPPLI